MISNKYIFSRDDIVMLIKKNKKTKDGNYWCPNIINIILIKGKVDDNKYFYERSLFKYKLYYSELDIEILLSEEPLSEIDIDEWYRKSLRFYDTNKELTDFDINECIPGQEFTIEELIDTYDFLI